MDPSQSIPGRLILGLGNPGAEYADTRHNLGFRVVDELARRWSCAVDRLECNSLIGERSSGEVRVVLAKPLTYMNRSGHAVRCLRELRGFEPSSALVVYDEIHLPLGRLRLRGGGSPGGHRGMESVVSGLRTDQVPRLRLGIAPDAPAEQPMENLVPFVLAAFEEGEHAAVDAMIARAASACEAWLDEGLEGAMNRFNG
ncbi:MAG: aminoacyl-tRNA hydrolase [Acidobacteriota bacterium]